MNSRAVLWGGAIGVVVLIIALLVLPGVYVALGLAVCLLIALVVVNRLREASDATREADNDESTSRLGTLVDDVDQEPYDSSTFDSAVFGSGSSDTLYEETPPADEQFEDHGEPHADWATSEFDAGTSFVGEDEQVDEFHTTYEATEYTSAFEAPAETEEFVEVEFDEYTGPSREVADYEYDSTAVGDRVADYTLDDVDASSVLADEGVIDESKVTTAESILAASQVSRFEPETMGDGESNEETREILGRVAALLAKYE